MARGPRDRIADGAAAGVHGRRPAAADVHRCATRPSQHIDQSRAHPPAARRGHRARGKVTYPTIRSPLPVATVPVDACSPSRRVRSSSHALPLSRARSRPWTASIRARTATSTPWWCSRTGKVLVGGAFTALGGGTGTTLRSQIGRLNHDGSLDAGFNPGANGDVYVLVVQPDGKILVGGDFTTLGGECAQPDRPAQRRRLARHDLRSGRQRHRLDHGAAAGWEDSGRRRLRQLGGGTRNRIGRLNPGGALDTGFNPGANDFVYTFAVQPGGQILVGGAFTTIGGGGTGLTSRNRIARLNADGSLDADFQSGRERLGAPTGHAAGRADPGRRQLHHAGRRRDRHDVAQPGRAAQSRRLTRYQLRSGVNNFVLTMTVQADGKILVGGGFTALGGATRPNLARLAARWRVLDASFDTGANSCVYALPVQPMGRSWSAATSRRSRGHGAGAISHIARLSESGCLDKTLHPGVDGAVVYGVAVQADGKIVVGGIFSALGGSPTRNCIGRLNADGAIDAISIRRRTAPSSALAMQPDGKILVGGDFTRWAARRAAGLGRLNADGSLDTGFDPGANDRVFASAMQPDGKILVGGDFTMLGGGVTGLNAPEPSRAAQCRRLARRRLRSGRGRRRSPPWRCSRTGRSWSAATSRCSAAAGRRRREAIGRLNADGSLDTSFDPGANGQVITIVVQPDGKILVGGQFTMLGGGGTGTTPRNRIGRLNADGSLDATFNPGAGANEFIHDPGRSGGWEDPGRWRLHSPERRGDRLQYPQPDRAVHRRWCARRRLQSGRERDDLRAGGASGWEDPGRRQLHEARRRRDRHDDARQNRPADEYRRGDAEPQRHEWRERRHLVAQRRRAGALARDLRVVDRRRRPTCRSGAARECRAGGD